MLKIDRNLKHSVSLILVMNLTMLLGANFEQDIEKVFSFEKNNNAFASEKLHNSRESEEEAQRLQFLKDEQAKEQALKEEQKKARLSAYFSQLQQALQKEKNAHEEKLAIAYIDKATGQVIEVNGESQFFAASTIKIPIAMRIADLIEEKKISWATEIVETEEDYEEGTGVIAGDGREKYTIEELVRDSIVYSDNIAKNMLIRQITPSYKETVKNIYQRYLPNNVTSGENSFSALQLAKILDNLSSERDRNASYEKIYQYMKQTIYHERLETSETKGKVAHKIGSNGSYFHDIGIFEGNYPYVLVVMTDEMPNATDVISEISNIVWRLQEKEYPRE
ncbi:beta-lactamase class A [Pilibacter termitis]|uniref:Beta-lactamase class A n=1 Tax=Pilibacter termitis TaxID=263852 RepID=A0A1T4MTI2_9ENTE|nr:serine hydrolase [Pilibacter termitis]SJZ70221.1 beta-lactamase class A [Pilibacter termitis]